MLRLLSISDGMDTLPCSIVLTRWEGEGSKREEEVVGHAHLMPVAGSRGAAFVETGERNSSEIHSRLKCHEVFMESFFMFQTFNNLATMYMFVTYT